MAATDSVEQVSLQAPAPAASASHKTPEQMRALAAQFESLLLTQMMNAMRTSMFDDKDQDAGFAKGPLADALYGELSLALSRAGGFGLGESMLGPMMRQIGNQTDNAAGTMGSLSTPLSVMVPTSTIGSAGPDALQQSINPAEFAVRSAMSALTSTPGDDATSTFDNGVSPLSLVSGRISSQFGWRHDPLDGTMKFHNGTDIAIPTGQDVPSAQAGQVTFAGERTGYGLTVEVSHGGGLTTRYAHLSEISVGVGDAVAEGQTIAKSGATGRVTGPHLHFEILDQGQPVDPSSGLMRLALAGRSAD
jgi:murein DD-endopeptidase MepM/ murein hydrolase activator NlpD